MNMTTTTPVSSRNGTFAGLPVLGVGLGYRDAYRAEVLMAEGDDKVDFLEIIADHYLDATPFKARELDRLAERYTLIPHGLNLSLGSAEGLDPAYRDQLIGLVNRLDPPWWSEHIAFTKAGGREIGHLAPVPFSEEALDVLVRNIEEVKRLTSVPLILENITRPFDFPGSTIDEADFLAELVVRTGCGLLLDVTNLHTNAVNLGGDAAALIDRLPADAVVQLHFVGGHWEGDQLIDSHSAGTPEEVWDLLDRVLARSTIKGMILERDEHLPPYSELTRELQRARELGRRHGRWNSPTPRG